MAIQTSSPATFVAARWSAIPCRRPTLIAARSRGRISRRWCSSMAAAGPHPRRLPNFTPQRNGPRPQSWVSGANSYSHLSSELSGKAAPSLRDYNRPKFGYSSHFLLCFCRTSTERRRFLENHGRSDGTGSGGTRDTMGGTENSAVFSSPAFPAIEDVEDAMTDLLRLDWRVSRTSLKPRRP